MSSIFDFGAPTYDQLQQRRRLVESLLPQNSRKPESAAKDKQRMMAQILAQQLAGGQPSKMPSDLPQDAPVPPTIGQVDPYGTDYNAVGARSFAPQGQPSAPRQSPASPGLLPRAIMHNGDAQYLPPAQYEDSPNAYWDAQRMGNGKGQSFYDVGGAAHSMPEAAPPMQVPNLPQVAPQPMPQATPQQNPMPYDRKGPIAPEPIDPNFDGRELLMPEGASLQPQGSFQPGAEYRTSQAGQIDPTLNSFQTDDAINKRRAEGEEMEFRGALSRLNNISDMLKENPDLIDSLTWTGSMKHRALALRDKTGFDFLEISPEQEDYLTESTVFRQNILRNINRTIQDVTGAQMGEQEARRIRAEMPDVNAGPAEFRAKLAAAMDMVRMDAARLQLWKLGGSQGNATDITDQSVRETLQVRGRELYDQFMSNGLSPSEARLKASQALSEEFGI